MDFTWAVKVKKKFEEIANELDKSVGQETAKYVEDRLQSAGGGMKKLCSNVQDLFAPFETHLVDQPVTSNLNDINKAESESASGELGNSMAKNQKSDANNVQENDFSEIHPECRPISLSYMNHPMISESDLPAEQNVSAYEQLDASADKSATEELAHISKQLGLEYADDIMIKTSAPFTNSVTDIDKDPENRMAKQTPLEPVADDCMMEDSSCEVHVVDEHVITASENLLEDIEPQVAPGHLDKTLAEKGGSSCEVRVVDQHVTLTSENLFEDLEHNVDPGQLDKTLAEKDDSSCASGNLIEDVEHNVDPGLLDKTLAEKDGSSCEVSIVDQHVTITPENLVENAEPKVYSGPLDKTVAEENESSCVVIVVDQNVTITPENVLEDAEPKVDPGKRDETSAEKDGSNCEVSVVDQHVTITQENLLESAEPKVYPVKLDKALAEKDESSCQVSVVDQHVTITPEYLLEDAEHKVDPGKLDETLAEKDGSSCEVSVVDQHVNCTPENFLENAEPKVYPNQTLAEKNESSREVSVLDQYVTITPENILEDAEPKFDPGKLDETLSDKDADIHTDPCITCCEDKAAERTSILSGCPSAKKSDLTEVLPDNSGLVSTQIKTHLEEPGCAGDSLVTGSLSLPDPARSSQEKLANIAPNYYGIILSPKSSGPHDTKVDNNKLETELSQQWYQSTEPAQIEALMSPKHTGCPDKNVDDLDVSSMETIDFKEKLKIDEICVNATDKEIYAAERQIRTYRSCGKKILDAFRHKRRIAKEYENLSIWFGETDFFPQQDSSHSLTQACPSKSMDLKDQAKPDTSESEWELI